MKFLYRINPPSADLRLDRQDKNIGAKKPHGPQFDKAHWSMGHPTRLLLGIFHVHQFSFSEGKCLMWWFYVDKSLPIVIDRIDFIG